MDEPEPAPVVGVTDPSAFDRAAAVLAGGGTVVVPTDTVYGVAALPLLPGATDQIYALKERAAGQPLAALVADLDQALGLVEGLTPEAEGWTAEHWPGPLTLVLRRAPAAADLRLGGDPGTIGVRCPAHPFVRALAARVGPLATTSANRSGEPTPPTAREAAASLVAPVDLVVDGGRTSEVASTVVDLTGSSPKVLRAGALDPARLGLA